MSGSGGKPAEESTEQGSGGGLTIGAVIGRLREDFPDLTVSKVRYLDAEGLVSPQRRGSGYREYTERDIERLRFVLAAQRDRFWPLRVIREALDAFDRGLVLDAGRPRVPEPSLGERAATRPLTVPGPDRPLRLRREELVEASGLPPQAVAELESFHLLRPDTAGHFDEDDLAVARAAQALAAYGVQGRHLRSFRVAADREIGLVEQAAGPRSQNRADVLAHCLSLHTALVRAGLRQR